MPYLRVQVSEASAAVELGKHLAQEGFPASMSAERELLVLFPGRRSIFAPAVELDLWRMNHTGVAVSVLEDGNGRDG
jgi:methyl coenzyme M reductase subunit C